MVATLLSLLLIYLGYDVATIGSAFQYTLSDGSTGFGIPNTLPGFVLPWNIPNAQGEIISWNFTTLTSLVAGGVFNGDVGSD